MVFKVNLFQAIQHRVQHTKIPVIFTPFHDVVPQEFVHQINHRGTLDFLVHPNLGIFPGRDGGLEINPALAGQRIIFTSSGHTERRGLSDVERVQAWDSAAAPLLPAAF